MFETWKKNAFYRKTFSANEVKEILDLAVTLANFAMDKLLKEDLPNHVMQYNNIPPSDRITGIGDRDSVFAVGEHWNVYDSYFEDLNTKDYYAKHYILLLLHAFFASEEEYYNNRIWQGSNEISYYDISGFQTGNLKILHTLFEYFKKLNNAVVNYEHPIEISFTKKEDINFNEPIIKHSLVFTLEQPITYHDSISLFESNRFNVDTRIGFPHHYNTFLELQEFVKSHSHYLNIYPTSPTLEHAKLMEKDLFDENNKIREIFKDPNILKLYDLSEINFIGKNISGFDVTQNIENIKIRFDEIQQSLRNCNMEGYPFKGFVLRDFDLIDANLKNTNAGVDLLSCKINQETKMSSGTQFDETNQFYFGNKKLKLKEVENLGIKIYRKER